MTTKNSKQALGGALRGRLMAPLAGGRAARLLALRRTAAVILAAVAGILALQPRPSPAEATVPALVTTRDLPTGHLLTDADMELRPVPAAAAPEGALPEVRSVVGRGLASSVRRGEVLTDARLTGSTPAEIPGSVSVPVRLADPGTVEFLHPGRRVDVVSADVGPSRSSPLAEGAAVVAIGRGEDSGGRLVLVSVPEQQARKLAAATLTQPVAITLR